MSDNFSFRDDVRRRTSLAGKTGNDDGDDDDDKDDEYNGDDSDGWIDAYSHISRDHHHNFHHNPNHTHSFHHRRCTNSNFTLLFGTQYQSLIESETNTR